MYTYIVAFRCTYFRFGVEYSFWLAWLSSLPFSWRYLGSIWTHHRRCIRLLGVCNVRYAGNMVDTKHTIVCGRWASEKSDLYLSCQSSSVPWIMFPSNSNIFLIARDSSCTHYPIWVFRYLFPSITRPCTFSQYWGSPQLLFVPPMRPVVAHAVRSIVQESITSLSPAVWDITSHV